VLAQAKAPVAVVEDNAHGLGATWNSQPLGTFGLMSTQSFHETKNVQTGEGGALLINDVTSEVNGGFNAKELFERAEIIREKGTNRSKFFRGQVDKYTWVDIGSSWLPSDITAALLLGQLEDFKTIQQRRHQIWSAYDEGLRQWATSNGHRQPVVPPGASHSAHIYYLLMSKPSDQQALIAHLDAKEIHATFHYRPLHDSVMGRKVGRPSGELPVTRDVSDRLVRLPIWPDMSEDDVARVVDAVRSYQS
jgi:dTDP-4-amino-4,6-dideoxygalactose transaminase